MLTYRGACERSSKADTTHPNKEREIRERKTNNTHAQHHDSNCKCGERKQTNKQERPLKQKKQCAECADVRGV